MFTIGEFSKATGLTVKTLRFYHDRGLLEPTCVDEQTGYRYYGEGKAERARVITLLRRLEFSVSDISELLEQCEDDADVLEYLAKQRSAIEQKLTSYRNVVQSIDQILDKEKKAIAMMQATTFEVTEKSVEPQRIAGVRMKGKYSDCGKGFGKIGRRFGRHICGPALLLIHDQEYKADDADFEACMPIRKGESTDEISVRELPGGRCVALAHQGPYDELGRSYEKILAYVKEKGYEIETPCREVYIKGPGMIFKGNPKKYLTEIQMLIRQ